MSSGDTQRVPSFQASGRIPELDGLRGVAIGLVLITHCLNVAATAGEPKYLVHLLAFICSVKSFAWLGVDLFLVLSGLLIGGKLLDTRRSPDYFKAFYARRARGILPAYFVFLSLMAFAYAFIYPSHRAAMAWPLDHPLPWYFYLTFTTNLWMAYHNSYGASGLAVLWSLTVEEQFYLVAPLLVRFVRPARLPHVFATGILSALLLRCVLQLIRSQARMALYVLLPCRVDALLWGMLAAYSLRRPQVWSFLIQRTQWIWIIFFVLGSAICLASFSSRMNIHSIATTTVGYDWLDVFYMTALVLVLVDRHTWLANVLRRPWLTRLGTISYSLYLIHYGVYGLSMGYLLGHSGPIKSLMDLCVTLFAVALAIGLATLSWEFFERPMLSHGSLHSASSHHSERVQKTPLPAALQSMGPTNDMIRELLSSGV
jgi:peptidoglycan/LPS O-acetylase OafA/YrhL